MNRKTTLKALVSETNVPLRDLVVVGLEAFGGIDYTMVEGHETLEMATKRDFDFIVYGLSSRGQDAWEIFESLQELEHHSQILVLAKETTAKKLGTVRAGSKVFSTIRVPLEPLEFYKTIARLKRRLLERK